MNKINVWIILICCDCLPIYDTKLRDRFLFTRCFRTICAQNCRSHMLCALISRFFIYSKIVTARWAYAELISNLFFTNNDTSAWHGVAWLCCLFLWCCFCCSCGRHRRCCQCRQHNTTKRSRNQVIHAIINVEANFSNSQSIFCSLLLRFSPVCSVFLFISFFEQKTAAVSDVILGK